MIEIFFIGTVSRYSHNYQTGPEKPGEIGIGFDNHQQGLISEITEIQHNWMYSSRYLHSHVSQTRCGEVLLVKGDAET